jgi:hypothetical protein
MYCHSHAFISVLCLLNFLSLLLPLTMDFVRYISVFSLPYWPTCGLQFASALILRIRIRHFIAMRIRIQAFPSQQKLDFYCSSYSCFGDPPTFLVKDKNQCTKVLIISYFMVPDLDLPCQRKSGSRSRRLEISCAFGVSAAMEK